MKSHIICFLLVVVFAGCKSTENSAPANPSSGTASTPTPFATGNPTSPTTNSAPAVKSTVDVCNLLTSDELKSAQGEAYKEAQRSDRQDGDFIVAQCYYQMPTMVNSVVLNVTTAREGAGGRNPRDFWEETFREADEAERDGRNKGEGEREREKQKAKAKAKDRREGEEEEEGLPPERVKGLGDEAFWNVSRVGGALYVLKKDQFFRISIGGSADARAKLNKSKMLAQSILNRL
jgi:hypothetical protein